MAESPEKNKEALNQALALLPLIGNNETSRREIISVAQKVRPGPVEPFEKDGCVWVGRLGLRFNKEDKIVEAVAGWSK